MAEIYIILERIPPPHPHVLRLHLKTCERVHYVLVTQYLNIHTEQHAKEAREAKIKL